MEIKVEAAKLVDKFYKKQLSVLKQKGTQPILEVEYEIAKGSAILCVEEIFDFMRMDDELHEDCHMANSNWPVRYQKIKQEINRLQYEAD